MQAVAAARRWREMGGSRCIRAPVDRSAKTRETGKGSTQVVYHGELQQRARAPAHRDVQEPTEEEKDLALALQMSVGDAANYKASRREMSQMQELQQRARAPAHRDVQEPLPTDEEKDRALALQMSVEDAANYKVSRREMSQMQARAPAHTDLSAKAKKDKEGGVAHVLGKSEALEGLAEGYGHIED